MNVKQSINIAFSGHRALNGSEVDRITETLKMVIADIGAGATVMTQLADGADQLAAKAALAVGAEVLAVVPMGIDGFCIKDLDQIESFRELIADKRVEYIEIMAQQSEDLMDQTVRDFYYGRANQYMLAHADKVLVVWDGDLNVNALGTAGVVEDALLMYKKPVIWVPGNVKQPISKTNIKDIQNQYRCNAGVMAAYGEVPVYYLAPEAADK